MAELGEIAKGDTGRRRTRFLLLLSVVALLLAGGAIVVVFAMSGDGASNSGDQGSDSTAPLARDAPPSADTRNRTVGWPNASNTGVPKGTSLQKMHQDLTISQPGMVLSNVEIHGSVTIESSNVTIKNSRIYGEIVVPYGHEDVSGVVISDTELDGQRDGDPNKAEPGIVTYGSLTCRACNVHGFNMGIAIDGDTPVLIEDSWVHDIWPSSTGHKDAIITNGSKNVTIDHNRLSCEVDGCSAAIGLFGDFSSVSDWVVNDNLFNGGSYCSYSGTLASKKYPVASNIKWTNNRYGRELHAKCGVYGSATGWSSGHGNIWSGNVWESSGRRNSRSAAITEP